MSVFGRDTQRAIDNDNWYFSPDAVQFEPKLVRKQSLPSRKPVRARLRSNVYVEIVNPRKSRFVQNKSRSAACHCRPRWILWLRRSPELTHPCFPKLTQAF